MGPKAVRYPTLSPSAWLRWDIIESHVRDFEPRNILELGVGRGAAGARLADMTDAYVGFEPDPTARAHAVHRAQAGATIVDDLDQIGGELFDLVCAFEVLEHIEDDRSTLRRWVEWVQPGGHLMVSTPAFAHRMGPMDVRVGHYRRYDPDQLLALLEGAGLTDVETTLIGFPLGYALEAARNLIARAKPADEASMSERSAESGRLLQPPDVPWLTDLGTRPFRSVQRRFPNRGTGVVAVARRPG